MDFQKYNIKEKEKKKKNKVTRIIKKKMITTTKKYIYTAFALKIGSFFFGK